ncbi:MAG TPA: NAD+ synthase [Jatrophihabitantaceae bacterium]|jgi:NAD+ synthase (glutamine-hydrolysing)|nr:NAD+ synthase [Jatrophihabitantaceae bacterium]
MAPFEPDIGARQPPLLDNGVMANLRLALAQVNSTVGDFAANQRSVVEHTRAAAAAGADLIAFPELHVTGYPPEDLVLRAGFRAASRAAVERLAAELAVQGLGDIAVAVGYVDDDGGARNALAFIHRGDILTRYYKHHLPNYGVFDERRHFVAGSRFVAVRHRGVDVALTICEDLWQDDGPFTVAGRVGVGLVVNINGSPYERNKDDLRLPLLRRRAAEAGAPILYVNAVGGQDELVFDGDSMVVAADGELLLRAPRYVEDIYYIDIGVSDAADDGVAPEYVGMAVERCASSDQTSAQHTDPLSPACAPPLPDEAEVWGALVIGLRDYLRKNGFRSVVLGMSGGIDSAVVAAIAADALGGDRVYGVSMPSSYSSEHSKSDAEELARRIGAHYRVVPIAPMVDGFVSALSLTGLAEENVQARVRGTTLMALSNAEGHLVLATGNKSELAVGYSTIYGDAVGGFAPIKDVPKSLVWELARWRNADAATRGEAPPIPETSISKPPSAELRVGQVDTDSLPDYELLDAILQRYIDGDQGVAEIVAAGFDAGAVARIATLVDRAEWKRRQYPPGSKISYKNFGRDRRLPITNRWREALD